MSRGSRPKLAFPADDRLDKTTLRNYFDWVEPGLRVILFSFAQQLARIDGDERADERFEIISAAMSVSHDVESFFES